MDRFRASLNSAPRSIVQQTVAQLARARGQMTMTSQISVPKGYHELLKEL